MIDPLTELRERLTYSAVAGTALLDEDFRLKKCMDVFAPLAQKNPVFGKLYDGLTELFIAEPAQRGKLLLHLLGLVTAVLYTQAGYGAEGDFTALPRNAGLGEIQQIPYQTLREVLEILTETGHESSQALTRMITEHPLYFGDTRVIDALVDALGNPSEYMTDLVFELLYLLAAGEPFEVRDADGLWKEHRLPTIDAEQLVHRLKQGFDPKGKTEMTRRLKLVSLLAGAAENDWYLSLLDTKDIRAFAVFSLGYKRENLPLLLELVKKERGRAKEMAYRALALWDTPEVVTFWEKTKNAKPAAYLSGTTLDVYGDLAAQHLKAALEKILDAPYITRKQMDDTIAPWIAALTGKASQGVIKLYEWILTQQARIPQIQDILSYHNQVQNTSMLPLFEDKIWETLILRCPKVLTDFLEQARKIDDKLWERAYFLADILTLPAAEFYDRWHSAPNPEMYEWFRYWVYKEGKCYMRTRIYDASIRSFGEYEYCKRIIREPLDLRWIDVFIEHHQEQIFEGFPADLPEPWRHKIGAYLYSCALQFGQEAHYHVVELKSRLKQMRRYGAQTYDNILVSLCGYHPELTIHQLREAFSAYQKYAGQENTEREAGRVLEFYHENGNLSADTILEMLKEYGFLQESGGK